jgi:predicted regulator of Ras-like GTPase activity (Roadblock/LC7/MglB family)
MEIADAYWRKEDVMPSPPEPAEPQLAEDEPVIPLKEETTPFEIDWEKSGEVLQAFLNDIKAVKGYLAFALVDAKGKILAADQSAYTLNLRVLAREMTPLFTSAQQAAARSSIDTAEALTIHSPACKLIMQLFQMNLFIMTACQPEGNWSEMKTRLDQMLASLHAA